MDMDGFLKNYRIDFAFVTAGNISIKKISLQKTMDVLQFAQESFVGLDQRQANMQSDG